jgi:hypothetical protein
MLNKEFQKKDVQRLRNLVQGKYGDKTTVGVGYSKKYINHEEGDVWEENGRQWTIKNGIKQNVTKLDLAKEAHVLPLLCPKCTKPMKTHIDKPFYQVHKMCLNCVTEFETKLKIEGKWEDYQKQMYNNAINNLINDFKDWAEDELKENNKSFSTEDGIVENWVGGNKDKLKKNIDDSLKYLEDLKNNSTDS